MFFLLVLKCPLSNHPTHPPPTPPPTHHTVRVFKNDARLRKPFHCCSALLLQMHLARHKHSSRISVGEAAPHFRNVCVYEPNVLQKKPSNLWKKPSDLRRKLCCKCILEKNSECWCHFFNTYHT